MIGRAPSGAAWGWAEELGDGNAGNGRGADLGPVGDGARAGNRSCGHGGGKVPGGFRCTFC